MEHVTHNNKEALNSKINSLLHKTIKKVTEDIEGFKFNTAISQMMTFVNEAEKEKEISKDVFADFLILLSPFAPHIAEELWHKAQNNADFSAEQRGQSIFEQKWPELDLELARDEKIQLVIQINGKVRNTVEVDADINEDEAKVLAIKNEKVKKWTEGKEIVKIIFAKGKLVNIVVK
jgi:leucyl-tRNA synthetase